MKNTSNLNNLFLVEKTKKRSDRFNSTGTQIIFSKAIKRLRLLPSVGLHYVLAMMLVCVAMPTSLSAATLTLDPTAYPANVGLANPDVETLNLNPGSSPIDVRITSTGINGVFYTFINESPGLDPATGGFAGAIDDISILFDSPDRNTSTVTTAIEFFLAGTTIPVALKSVDFLVTDVDASRVPFPDGRIDQVTINGLNGVTPVAGVHTALNAAPSFSFPTPNVALANIAGVTISGNDDVGTFQSVFSLDVDSVQILYDNAITGVGNPVGRGIGILGEFSVVVPEITLLKTVASGAAAPTAWTLSYTGPAASSSGSGTTGSITDVAVAPGTYTLAESGGPVGYVLTDLICTNAAAGGTDVSTVTVANPTMTLSGDDDVTCTFTNSDVVAPEPTKVFSPTPIAVGGTSTLTITLANTNATTATLTSALTDILPADVFVATPTAIGGTCTGSVTAVAASSAVSYASGATIPAGGCTITVEVTSSVVGTHTNTIAAGDLVTDLGTNTTPTTTDLVVIPTPVIELIKSIGSIADGVNAGNLANVVDAGDVVTYAFTVTNTGNVSLAEVGVTDSKITAVSCVDAVLLPNASTTCSGTYTLTQGDVDAGGVENTADVASTPVATDPISGLPDAGSVLIDPATGVAYVSGSVVDTSDAGTEPEATAVGGTPTAITDPELVGTDNPLGENAATADTTDDPTTLLVAPTPVIELVKSITNVDDSNGVPGIVDEGDVVTYTFSVTNSGNVALADVIVSDTSLPACPVRIVNYTTKLRAYANLCLDSWPLKCHYA